jgi:hypothetical protein
MQKKTKSRGHFIKDDAIAIEMDYVCGIKDMTSYHYILYVFQ